MTETALADLLAKDLSSLDLVAAMIDGVHFAEHLYVVALGIDIDGVKLPLAVVEGSTENTTLVKSLLVGLRERGLDTTRPILAVLHSGCLLGPDDVTVIGQGSSSQMRTLGAVLKRHAAHQRSAVLRSINSQLPRGLGHGLVGHLPTMSQTTSTATRLVSTGASVVVAGRDVVARAGTGSRRPRHGVPI